MHLDEELTFRHLINEKINKSNNGIGTICKLNNILLCHALLTIYHSFVRPNLDYGDMIYDQAKNELVQYNVSLAKTGAVGGIFQEKLYQELSLKSIRTRKKAHVLLLQTNYNSKVIIPFQSNTSNLREWNELCTEIRNSTSYQQFSLPNFTFNIKQI